MRRRPLNAEERQLWEAVAKSARPIRGRAAFVADNPPDPPRNPTAPPPPAPKPRIDPFVLGETAPRVRPRLDQPKLPGVALAEAPLNMDARTHTRMRRGKLDPEARIDLHGMTLAEAHAELIAFILGARAQGLRLVLVITGKGRSAHDQTASPHRIGALRAQVPHWLRLPPLGPAVQQTAEAHLRHGGSGAYYVYLRRK